MTTRAASVRTVLAVRPYRAIWAAHALSVIGDQLARVALTILVFQRTASAGLTALTYALTYLPDIAGGALGGLADRYPRRTVLVAVDLARVVLVLAMAIPGLPLIVAAALLALTQLFAGPFQAGRQALLPDLLEPEQVAVGQGLMASTYQIALVIGFGFGGAVVTYIGVTGALWIDAGTFLLSALLLRFVLPTQPPQRAEGGPVPTQWWSTITGGARLVAGDARLRSLLALACCCGFYVVPEGLAVPVVNQLGTTAGVGLLLVANPIGSVLGMIVIARIPRSRQAVLLGPLVVATSAVLVLTPWAPGLAGTAVLWALSGAFSAHDMITQAEYGLAVPTAHRAQAFGVALAALRAAQGLGIVLAGLLSQVLRPTLVVLVAAVVGTCAAAAAATSWARARRAVRDAPGDGDVA
jgi:predicted MFS family arabinose efflux permease